MKNNLISAIGVLSVIILSYWSFAQIFLPGVFPVHDDTQVARVQQMAKALSDGMFPVRWVSDLGYGYGYPIFTFYGPFAYYLGSVFVLFGADALLATKLMMMIGVVLSGVGMYFLARVFWGKAGGIVSAILYVYAPYHAVNIYVRGAVGEYFGYAFIPFVFFGVIRAYQSGKFRYVVIAGLSYAALLLSHNLTGLMVTPFLVMLLLFLTVFSLKKQQKVSFYFMYLSFFFGLIISAFYWIPALLEMGYTNVISQVGGAADFREHYICLPQLWESQWGFGGSVRGCVDGLSYRIGKLHILFAGLALVLLPFIYKKERCRTIALVVSFAFLCVSVFFSLDYSMQIWKALPILSFIQYPWRLLSVVTFFASFLGGAGIWFLSEKLVGKRAGGFYEAIVAVVFSVIVISFYAKLFVPQTIIPKTARDLVNMNTLRWDTSRISDEYLPIGFSRPQIEPAVPLTKFSVSSGDAVLTDEWVKTQEASVLVEGDIPSRVSIFTAYFPAWRVYVDGKQVEYATEKNGMSVIVPSGSHLLQVKYVSTSIEKIANIVSLIGIFGLITGIIFFRRKRAL